MSFTSFPEDLLVTILAHIWQLRSSRNMDSIRSCLHRLDKRKIRVTELLQRYCIEPHDLDPRCTVLSIHVPITDLGFREGDIVTNRLRSNKRKRFLFHSVRELQVMRNHTKWLDQAVFCSVWQELHDTLGEEYHTCRRRPDATNYNTTDGKEEFHFYAPINDTIIEDSMQALLHTCTV